MHNPYFADFDSDGTAAVFVHTPDPKAEPEVLWRLAGHTTLDVATALAERMNADHQAQMRRDSAAMRENFR